MPRLTISSLPDTQVFLIGGNLQLIRRGMGGLTADLEAGLYKIKAERGGGTVERLLDLREDETVHLEVDTFPAIAPLAPLLGGDAPTVEGVAAEAFAVRPTWVPGALAAHLARGDKTGILVLAHQAVAFSDAGPLARLRLIPCGVEVGVDLDAAPACAARTEAEIWGAAWLPLRPDSHVLEIVANKEIVRQTVLVAPGWQTRVFACRRRWRQGGEAPAAVEERERVDVSIQMARRGTSVVYSDHFETVEVARNALELSRTSFVAARLVEDLLTEKFDNPIAGITGLHLFLGALEGDTGAAPDSAGRTVEIEPATRRRAPEIVRAGIAKLERLLGCREGGRPEPSDLIALKARANLLPPRETLVREPPMFWAAWQALVRSGPDQPVVVAPALWRRIAWANAWGPYLAWPPRETTLADFMAAHRPSRGLAAAASSGAGSALNESAIEPTRAQLAFEPLEGDELARALGIPLSVIGSRGGGREM